MIKGRENPKDVQKKRKNFVKINEMERTYMVLAVMLSDFPERTMFNSRDNKSGYLEHYLDGQISELLSVKREHPAVKEIFTFDYKCDHWCNEAKRYLDVMFGYGKRIGLDNWGADFDYRLSHKDKLIEFAAKAKELMPAEDFEFYRRLGRNIVFNGKDKLSDEEKKANKKSG